MIDDQPSIDKLINSSRDKINISLELDDSFQDLGSKFSLTGMNTATNSFYQ